MLKLDDFPDPVDYRNYRNIRAVAIFFVLLGGFLLLTGIVLANVEFDPGDEGPPNWLPYVVIVLGISGFIGGLAVLFGALKYSKLIYVLAVFYLFAFPLGTILSVVMINGLPRYLRNLKAISERNEMDSKKPEGRSLD